MDEQPISLLLWNYKLVIQPLLSLSITSNLDWAITVSRQDYCNCLLLDLPPALASNLFSMQQPEGSFLKHNLVYVSSLLSSLQRIPSPQYEIQGPTKPISPSVSHYLLQGSLLSSHPGLLAVPETGQGHSHLKAMHLLFLLPGIFFP